MQGGYARLTPRAGELAGPTGSSAPGAPAIRLNVRFSPEAIEMLRCRA